MIIKTINVAGNGSTVFRTTVLASLIGLISACSSGASTAPVVDRSNNAGANDLNNPIVEAETDPNQNNDGGILNDDSVIDNTNTEGSNTLLEGTGSPVVEDTNNTDPSVIESDPPVEDNDPTIEDIDDSGPVATDPIVTNPIVIDNDPNSIQVNRVLAPLPTPSLTPAPGQDSEPVRATGPVSTVSEFFLVRNPSRDLRDTSNLITDAEFAAGPLPAEIQIPDHVDPTNNSAPFFDNLNDVEVFAGQTLNLRLRPLDNDGGVPGLFPHDVPVGAQYVDNFDGTRSLIWSPLQPDVGIREFNRSKGAY